MCWLPNKNSDLGDVEGIWAVTGLWFQVCGVRDKVWFHEEATKVTLSLTNHQKHLRNLFKIQILRLCARPTLLGGAGKLWQMLACLDEGGLYQRGSLTCILKGEYDLNVWRVEESQSWLTQSVYLAGFVEMTCKVLGVGVGKIFWKCEWNG